MSKAIEEAMLGAQNEYRRLIQLVGHWRATNLNAQKQVEEFESQLMVIMKKISNYESQMPKQGENQDGQSSSPDNSGSDSAEPKQNTN